MIKTLAREAVELLKEMVAIPSPSFEEADVCGHSSQWMSSKSIEHQRVGNNIIAEYITLDLASRMM